MIMADRPRAASYIELLIAIDHGECRVVDAGWTKQVSGWHLRPPFLKPECSVASKVDLSPYRDGDAELVVRTKGKKGELLDEFGWSAQPHRWVDVLPDMYDLRAYKRMYRPRDLRTVRLPIRTGAALLEVSRDVVKRASHPTVLLPASSAHTSVDVGLPKTYPILWGRNQPILFPPHSRKAHWCTTKARRRHEAKPVPNPLKNTRAERTGFDIVVTGDGFTSGEQDWFVWQASRLVRLLRNRVPFCGHSGVRWHILPAVSRMSGTELRPSEPIETYYEIFCVDLDKDEKTVTPGGYSPARLWPFIHSTRIVGPWQLIDLVITIVNHHGWGGHAWPDLKVAVVPILDDANKFARLAAHESAHVIGHLAEEYPVPGRDDPLNPAPNMAFLSEVATSVKAHIESTRHGQFGNGWPAWDAPMDRVWWRGVGEDRPRGRQPFTAVHVPGDPWPVKGRVPRGFSFRRLGAFWGCERSMDSPTAKYVATYLGSQLGVTADTLSRLRPAVCRAQFGKEKQGQPWRWRLRGMLHFRPTADCMMVNTEKDFCRVCKTVLNEVIEGECSHPNWAQPRTRVGLGRL